MCCTATGRNQIHRFSRLTLGRGKTLSPIAWKEVLHRLLATIPRGLYQTREKEQVPILA